MRAVRKLRHDRRGATLVEFAFVAPVFLLLLMGMFDVGHQLYVHVVLQGAMQKSARDSTLEAFATSSTQAALDTHVREQVEPLTFGEQLTFRRRFYRTFDQAAAARRENFTDVNGNGVCDNGEQYSDDNNNQVWDVDGGDAGQGLAFDKAVYTATVTFPRLFPLWRFTGSSERSTVEVRTVLMNQPYTGQKSYGAPTARNCP